ncbi:DUF4336 domain-containing protein [uncultured Aliiroseovarius sp.]|nr:DUF4336 domain-containing protein [Aliiroseovarius subalbicans]MCI2400306.1 DUF4336 domain-containing protein [Aliiroseovarius subalbicans]
MQSFGDRIWIADAAPVSVAGFHYPTRMVVIRLADGGVMAVSPVALTSKLRDAVAALGPVRHLIAPNALHHLFLGDWAEAFPEAKVHAAPGLRAKRKDIRFDADLGDAPDPDWAGDLEQVVVRGNLITEEVVFFHAPSRTVLFTDLLQQFPRGWHAGWRGVVARLDLMVGAEPAVPRKFRAGFVNRRAARQAVARILTWPADNVLLAHGAPVMSNGQAFLTGAFRWLMR